MVTFGTHLGGATVSSSNKITKSKGKMVKPILKKLSHSPKNSLDLDRGWDEQQVEQLENSEWDGGDYGYGSGYGGQARDVSFGIRSSADVGAGGGSFRAKFQHGRSGSQTSAGSGPRGGFVHPFAQTPRTSTPPLSYANSLASLDNGNGRDCSPTITENEDDDEFDTDACTAHPPSVVSHAQSSSIRRPSQNSQRTPSLFSEIPQAQKPPSLRINTGGRSVSGVTSTTATSSRLAYGSSLSSTNHSHSDLHLNHTHVLGIGRPSFDSPTGSLCGTPPSSFLQQQQQQQQPSPAHQQMSPLRTSLDGLAGSFPRLRSRSELDTASRAENIRAARRKFEERERVKEEKYDREMIRKRERRDTKEATRILTGAESTSKGPKNLLHHHHSKPKQSGVSSAKGSGSVGAGSASGVGVRRRITPSGLVSISTAPPAIGKGAGYSSSASPSPRLGGFGSASAPAATTTPTSGLGIGIGRRRHTTDAAAPPGMSEKMEEPEVGFASRKYESVPFEEAPPAFGPAVDDVRFEQTRRKRGGGAKRKTQSYWQGFILWLRTKLLRLGSR
ncbi:hypothetical protein VTK26DRAFT_5533 [Humicola hyalothermophila]